MSDRTPIQVPPAPQDWRMNPDQLSRVAQDPRLHHLTHDELYHFFNPPQAPAQSNVFSDLAHRAMQFLAPAFQWHPASTLTRAANALGDANDGMQQ